MCFIYYFSYPLRQFSHTIQCLHNKDSGNEARSFRSKDVDLDHNDVDQSANNYKLLTTIQGAAAEQIPDIHICQGNLADQNVSQGVDLV